MTLLAWYDQNKRNLPWRLHQASFLNSQKIDPYPIWVSEVMLQQTLIAVVVPAWQRFMAKFPNVFALASATSDDIRPVVRGLGYYRRFDLLHRAAKVIADQSPDGKTAIWPDTREGWQQLPGIGDYTSAAIASIALNIPVPVVDGNVERVLCRLNDIRKAPNSPELKPLFRTLMDSWLDHKRPGDFNQAVMELGQRICTPTSPECRVCPISKNCLAMQRNSQHLAPGPKIRPEFETVSLDVVIWTRPKKPKKQPAKQKKSSDHGFEVALFERTAHQRFLKGSTGFWYSDQRQPENNTNLDREHLITNHSIGQIKHAITRHKITAKINWINGTSLALDRLNPRWIPAELVEDALISNFDLKAWRSFIKKIPAELRRD